MSTRCGNWKPWDGEDFKPGLHARVRLVPHGPLRHTQRWRLAQEFTRPALSATIEQTSAELPSQFGPLGCDGPNVALSAFFRESEAAGALLERYAGSGLGYPYVLRLVELDGLATLARLHVAGPVASAFRANLLGEVVESLPVQPAETEGWSELVVMLRPYEIATLYLDLELGRKTNRNLDTHRSVWATIHRVGEE